MGYRERAQLVTREIDSEGHYIECFRYHGKEYWVSEKNEVPAEMQHYFEQTSIDYIDSEESENDWS